jgi:hypothetical protein
VNSVQQFGKPVLSAAVMFVSMAVAVFVVVIVMMPPVLILTVLSNRGRIFVSSPGQDQFELSAIQPDAAAFPADIYGNALADVLIESRLVATGAVHLLHLIFRLFRSVERVPDGLAIQIRCRTRRMPKADHFYNNVILH